MDKQPLADINSTPRERQLTRFILLLPLPLLTALSWWWSVLYDRGNHHTFADAMEMALLANVCVLFAYLPYLRVPGAVRPAAVAATALMATLWMVFGLWFYWSMTPSECCNDVGQFVALIISVFIAIILFLFAVVLSFIKPAYLRSSVCSAVLGVLVQFALVLAPFVHLSYD